MGSETGSLPGKPVDLAGLVCVLSILLGLVIFIAVEGTCMFYKRLRSLYFCAFVVAPFYTKTNITRAWTAALNRNSLAIGHRHSARRQRIAPFDLRCASLPVPPLFART